MLSPDDIQEILTSRIKPIITKNTQLKKKQEPYYEGYDLFLSWRNGIRVHSETGVFPTELLLNRSPNVTEDEWKYIVANYKQVTGPVAVDYLSTVNRAWSDNNWSIDYNGEDEFQEYVTTEVVETPLKMSVEDYFKSVFPYVKMIDSMGCIVIKPHFVPIVEVDGEFVISGDAIEPIPVYYSTAQLVAFDEDKFFMFQVKEKSLVQHGNRNVREGLIYEVYDDTNIWRVVQTGRKIDYEFDVFLYWKHDGNAIPVSRCKGVPVVHNDEIVWQSRFLAVKDLLDEVILDSVYLRGVKNICAFPYRVMTGNICNHKMEINGEIQNCDGTGFFIDFNTNAKTKCPNCYNGLVDRVSPYGQMLLRPESRDGEGELKTSQPAMYYVAPPIDTPQFLRNEIDNTFNKARSILHLHTSNSDVKGSEEMTATGMALDMKALYAFVKSDSSQTFKVYEWALGWIGFMRFNEEPDFSLTLPTSFDFYTDYDYLQQVSEAIKNGLPPFLVQATILKYMKSLFASDIQATRAYDLIISADRLITMTDEELVIKKAQGLVADWEIILHDSGIVFVAELFELNPNFFESKDQKEQLIQMAKDKAAETKIKTTTAEEIIAVSESKKLNRR